MSRRGSGGRSWTSVSLDTDNSGTKIGSKNSPDLWSPRRAKLGPAVLFSYKLGMRNAEVVKTSLLDKKERTRT